VSDESVETDISIESDVSGEEEAAEDSQEGNILPEDF
jgi:hypothetical protein